MSNMEKAKRDTLRQYILGGRLDPRRFLQLMKLDSFGINDVIEMRWQKTVLTLASEAGHVDYVRVFIEDGSDVHHVTRHKKKHFCLQLRMDMLMFLKC